MAGEQVTVVMTGGCPWGFRLFGGDEDPLVVAKLRKRSKAHESGLHEGDALLGINGRSCQGMTHATAMALADSSGYNLSLLVLRGANDRHAVHAAFHALGSQLQPLPTSALPQERSSGSNQVPQFQSSERSQVQAYTGQAPAFQSPVRASALQNSVVNGPGAEVRREEKTFQDENTTRRVTTETRTEQFGGTKLTKITREEVSRTVGGGVGGAFDPVHNEPRQSAFSAAPHFSQPSSMFQVSNFSANANSKSGAWAPTQSMTVSAPSGVHVHQHPDQSITMSIAMGGPGNEGKENVAPRPNFNQTQPSMAPKAKPGVWQPSFTPAPPKPRPPSPPLEPMQEDSTDFPKWAFPSGTRFQRDNAPPAIPTHVTKIMQEGSGSDDCSSPSTPTGLSKKKKLFGDSAFYDDPEHKYPTIEEQVKMARRVAMSLTSPANTKARGHRMFIKRQEKSHKWTKSDEVDGFNAKSEPHESDDEKFFQSDPWAAKAHSWQPPKPGLVRRGEIPPAPPVPSLPMWAAPVIPKPGEEKSKALSAEEFERMRLYESKTQHTTVSPQACFALAEDLRQMKGKGGRLFAKRKARAEKYVHEEPTAPPPPANAELIQKLTGGLQVGVPDEEPRDVRQGAIPVNRLKQMIEIPKPSMSPWEAAMESGGRVDRAFEHLDGITFTRKATAPGGATMPLDMDLSSPTGSLSGVSGLGSGPAKMPEFSRKITPWGEPQASLGFQPAPPAPAQKPSPRPPPKSWQPSQPGGGGGHFAGQSSGGGGGGAGVNFRPINFKAASEGNPTGVFNSPWQANASAGRAGGGPTQQTLSAGGDGYCDL